MGNDGGSIPKRSEVVKHKKHQNHAKVDKEAKNFAKRSLCAMSKEPLRAPIVACKRGLLYNKEHLIRRLLEKNVPREFRHIAKLSRDTVQVSDASLESTSSSFTTSSSIFSSSRVATMQAAASEMDKTVTL